MTVDHLTVEDVLAIHADQVARYGGGAGVRDVGLLESAVLAAQASFEGRSPHADIFDMAAAYLYHLVQNHPFIDGNKRTGAAAALVFLDINDVEIDTSDEDLYTMVMGVASGVVSRAQVSAFFRARGKPA